MMEEEEVDRMYDQFVTLQALSSFPGMVLMVSLLTQFTKGLVDKLISNHTSTVVFAYSLILMLFISYAKEEFTGDFRQILIVLVMDLLNAVVVALAAMKGYEKVKSNRYVQKMFQPKQEGK